MKRLLTLIAAVSLGCCAILPYRPAHAQSSQTGLNPTLVPEGEFALQLATELHLGTITLNGNVSTYTPPADYVEAEDLLFKEHIAPKSGFISEYPMTPDVVEEMRSAVDIRYCRGPQTAPDGECNAMVAAFYRVVNACGLGISPSNEGGANTQPAPAPSQNEVNTYYAINGPPIVTYYGPPIAYVYLYAWLPYPFWFGGFWFPGYWMLHDFHRPVYYRGHTVIITNHFVGHDGRHIVVDPVAHRNGTWRTGHEVVRPEHPTDRHPIMPPVDRRPGMPPPHSNPGFHGGGFHGGGFHGGHGR